MRDPLGPEGGPLSGRSMADAAAHTLFAVAETKPDAEPTHSTGVVPAQGLRAAIASGEIDATEPIREEQIQPASLDLRLGPVAWRTRASFLPGRGASVGQKIKAYAMHRFPLDGGAVLERGCVYVAPVMESLRLRHRTSAVANPKSSTGRLDVFCRLITDGGMEFDRAPAGFVPATAKSVCSATSAIDLPNRDWPAGPRRARARAYPVFPGRPRRGSR